MWKRHLFLLAHSKRSRRPEGRRAWEQVMGSSRLWTHSRGRDGEDAKTDTGGVCEETQVCGGLRGAVPDGEVREGGGMHAALKGQEKRPPKESEGGGAGQSSAHAQRRQEGQDGDGLSPERQRGCGEGGGR